MASSPSSAVAASRRHRGGAAASRRRLSRGYGALALALLPAASAFVGPSRRATTPRRGLNNMMENVGLDDAFDGALSGLFDALQAADLATGAAEAAGALAAADPVVQAAAGGLALAAAGAARALPLEGLLGAPGFPKIYGSWFGDRMAGDMRACIAAGLRSGLMAMEVRTQAVPNLDEAKFGTPTNEKFQIEVARNLGLSSGPVKPSATAQRDAGGLQKNVKRFDANYMLVKRDPIAYANVEWARRIAPAFGARKTVWVLLAEGRVDTAACSKLPKNFVVKPLESKDVAIDARDAVIVVSPGVTTSWQKGYDLAAAAGAPVVFLNSQLSERYALGGPLDDVEEVYYLKPISKGFVFRAFPRGWECWLDKPDGTQERLAAYAGRPSLGDLSSLARSASQEKYGAIFNEKFTNDPRFGGRM